MKGDFPPKALLEPISARLTPRRQEIVDWAARAIVPSLMPALRRLAARLADMEDYARGEDEQHSYEFKSLPLRDKLSRQVTPVLTRGMRLAFHQKPADPIDFLAKHLFSESSDESDGDDVEETFSPLRFLAQYLMRHSAESSVDPRHFETLVPTKLSGAQALIYEGGSSEGNCRLRREIRLLRIGLDEKSLVLQVTKDQQNYVTYSCLEHDSVVAERIVSELELHQVLIPRNDCWAVNTTTAALELVDRIKLIKTTRSLKLTFGGCPDAPRREKLATTIRRESSRIYLVDVWQEKVAEDEKEDSLCHLILKAYESAASTTSSLVISNQPISTKVSVAKLQIANILERVKIKSLSPRMADDSHEDAPRFIAFELCPPLTRLVETVHNDPNEPTKCSLQKFEINVALVARSTSSGKDGTCVLVSGRPIGSVADAHLCIVDFFQSPIDCTAPLNVGDEPLHSVLNGLRYNHIDNTLTHATRQIAALPTATRKRIHNARALDTSLNLAVPRRRMSRKFNESVVNRRDALLKTKRDRRLMDRQRLAGDQGKLVHRQVRIINGIYWIVSVFVVIRARSGQLRFEAYDPVSCESAEVQVKHTDTRSLCPSDSQLMIGRRQIQLARELCSKLWFESNQTTNPGATKSSGGQGGVRSTSLALWEEDAIHTKLKRAYDRLPKDLRGFADRRDVVEVFSIAQDDLASFLLTSSTRRQRGGGRAASTTTIAPRYLPPLVSEEASVQAQHVLCVAKARIASQEAAVTRLTDFASAFW